MADKWPTAGLLPVHCMSNVKGRASGVFLPQMERRQPRGGMGTTSSPRCGAWPHACSLLLCWEEPAGGREAGLPDPGQTESVRVSREALHRLQGTLNLADLHNSLSVPALREDRFSVSTWSESAMSMCHENNVLAVTPTIHSTSQAPCSAVSPTNAESPHEVLYQAQPGNPLL